MSLECQQDHKKLHNWRKKTEEKEEKKMNAKPTAYTMGNILCCAKFAIVLDFISIRFFIHFTLCVDLYIYERPVDLVEIFLMESYFIYAKQLPQLK